MTKRQSDIVVTDEALDAERCIVELERGREVIVRSGLTATTVALVETLKQETLQKLAATGDYQLVLTQARANALGYSTNEQLLVIQMSADTTLQQVQALSGLQPVTQLFEFDKKSQVVTQTATAALTLARQAAVLPACLMYSQPVQHTNVLEISAASANRYLRDSGALIELSHAKIPLATADEATLTVFRELHGSAEHVAIAVGKPDLNQPVTVRLHSSCFTGDILGSLRCDCGEQLQGSIASMAKAGGGIVLYVSQEGRGIGLASKLRAYQLQDEGLDTIEANQHLGFEADLRRYPAAVSMLRSLGIQQIRLVTNNPTKIEALRRDGINIVERLPSFATVNVHNERYLETKRERAGHLSVETTL